MATTLVPATITYQKPGTKPPLYVAGTFSDPAWQLEEMEYIVDADGEHLFKKEVQGEPGSKIHYKFRIGDGDWWVLNDGTPTVTDIAGNKNNELEVVSPKGSPGEQKVGNGDAAVPKTVGPGEGGIQPVINVAKEILSRSEPRSGTETPIFARTAAEVADSAALLNEEEPEDDMPDEEAGRIGFRRLSGTPISEVANTAAEVADSAQGLDNPEVVIHNYPREVYSFRDDDDVGDRPPLFAHECVGMYNAEELETPNKSPEEDKDGDAPAEEVDPDGIDMNDPTLERFPSNREGIMDTVRKLETGLGEDHAAFEGVPLSPVVGAYRPGMEDITGDPFLSSPIVASPIIPRPSRHLEVPRSPHGSISSNHSSPLSLQAIDEGEEPSGSDEESDAILLSPPRPRPGFRAGKRSSTDEDEGIAMKNNGSSGSSNQGDGDGSSPKKAESPRDVISRALQEESPDIEAASASRPTEPQHSLTTPASSPDRHKTESPQIVIQSVEDNEADGPETGRQEDGEAGPATASDSSNRDAGDVGTSSAIEANAGDSNQVRKRGDTVARSGTPASNHSISIHPNREGGWFKNFFRLLFVDWIGGFIRRLCGGRRQTLLTAGAAAVFMGFSWWKIYGNDGRSSSGSKAAH